MIIELWTPLEFPGIKDMYEISSTGSIRNKYTGKFISVSYSEKGYAMVSIMGFKGKQITKKLHRIVAYNFLGKEKFHTFTVNHKDGNKKNNAISNLEYITFAENVRHSYETGLNKGLKGVDNGSAKTTEEQVVRICELLSEGYSTSKIKRTFAHEFRDVSKYVIHDIKRRKTWNHISKDYIF